MNITVFEGDMTIGRGPFAKFEGALVFIGKAWFSFHSF
jgi:hypothetical protein